MISSIGFQNYTKTIKIDKEVINLGKIELQFSNALDEVVVKSRAPITIKKDTLEFNVKSFKTKKDASVEDLLKQLPGVEVDDEGKITVNGKEVNKILVNGKPFFGDDPTITTRNLTKEIIEKGLKNRLEEIWGVECTLYYPEKYAGTADCVGVYEGRETIIDFKQSNKPKKVEYIDSWFLQTSAYSLAHNIVYNSNITSCVILVCTVDNLFQEFKIQGSDLITYQNLFLGRLKKFNENLNNG